MSQTASQTFINDKRSETEQDICAHCGNFECDEHIILAYTANTDPDFHSKSVDACNDRAPKRKLELPLNESNSHSLDIIEECSSNDIHEGESKCKKIKEPKVEFKEEPKNVQSNGEQKIVSGITSQMLSDNEMLITLPYTECSDLTLEPVDFANEISVGFEQHEEELNNVQLNFEHEMYPKNLEESNTSNILTIENTNKADTSNTVIKKIKMKKVRVLKPKYIQREMDSRKIVLIHNDTGFLEEPQDKNNVKLLTVLSNVNLNQIASRKKEKLTNPSCVEDEKTPKNFEFQREVLYESEEKDRNLGNSNESEESTNLADKKQEHKPIIQSNTTECKKTPIGETQRSSSKEELFKRDDAMVLRKEKRNKKMEPIVQSYKTKCKQTSIRETKKPSSKEKKLSERDDITILWKETINEKMGLKPEKLYKKIPKETAPKFKEPDKFSVYEFFDEDEEKLKEKCLLEEEQKKELKERTCKFCNEIFDDPIDVLRHKRQFHKPRKIVLPKEELEPYLRLENQTNCPLCFKELGKKPVYKSVYEKHIMTHCDEYSFQCRVCKMRFRRKDHWITHEVRHVVKPSKVNKED